VLLIKVCITILQYKRDDSSVFDKSLYHNIPQRRDDSSVVNKGLYHNIPQRRDDSSVVNKGLYHNITTETRRQQCG